MERSLVIYSPRLSSALFWQSMASLALWLEINSVKEFWSREDTRESTYIFNSKDGWMDGWMDGWAD